MHDNFNFLKEAGIPEHLPTPQGGWKFVVPNSMSNKLAGAIIKETHAITLFESVSRLFLNNGEPFICADFIIELKNQYPEEIFSRDLTGNESTHEVLPKIRGTVTFKTAVEYLKFMWRWIRNGGTFVSKEEAKRRYSICQKCPLKINETSLPNDQKTDPRSCGTCGMEKKVRREMYELIKSLGPVDESLQLLENSELNKAGMSVFKETSYCNDCLCEIPVRVWYSETKKCWE